MNILIMCVVFLMSGITFARSPNFDPTGVWNTDYLICYGRSDYADATEPILGTSFDCNDFEIDPPKTQPVFVLYNEDSEVVTISGGARESSPATFALDDNLVGWSRWREIESEERVEGCTVTAYFSHGIQLNSEKSIRYLVSYDYQYSPGCSSYLQEVGAQLEQGTSSLSLLRALYGTDSLNLDQIDELTNARLTIQYRGSRANAADDGDLAGEAATEESNPQNPEKPS